MKRIKVMLGVFAVVLVLAASAAPALASRGDDDSCFWALDLWWGWFLVCDDFDAFYAFDDFDDFDDGFHHDDFDDGDHHGGGGNSGPG
jgi:hypothetical protein